MASKFVIPYRQNEKNDTNDAEATSLPVICPLFPLITI